MTHSCAEHHDVCIPAYEAVKQSQVRLKPELARQTAMRIICETLRNDAMILIERTQPLP